MNYESNDQKYLQLALFAQEDFRSRLQHPRYRNLVNRAAMSSTLDVLTLSETTGLLQHRWSVAGGKELPFTEAAVEQIHLHSEGVPRTQVVLAGNAILAAYLRGTERIGPDDIRAVVHDRRLPDTRALTHDAEPSEPTQIVRLGRRP
jgi:type II secretory pathway predicted ATPase ExeA